MLANFGIGARVVTRPSIFGCFAVSAALAVAVFIAPKAVGNEQAGITDVTVSTFDIEAHRGGRALFPENTLVSFSNALSMGVATLVLTLLVQVAALAAIPWLPLAAATL